MALALQNGKTHKLFTLLLGENQQMSGHGHVVYLKYIDICPTLVLNTPLNNEILRGNFIQ